MAVKLEPGILDDELPPNDLSLRSSPRGLGWLSPSLITTLIVFAILYLGWQIRDEYYLSAESGVGYGLGIAGGSMMLLLLVYPLRKRFYNSRLFIFSTRQWFMLHMVFGVFGPLCILFHCNFSFGSTNSNVALISMILMVSSGLIGRFIYGKIHFGLYGNKAELKALRVNRVFARQQLDKDKELQQVLITDTLINKIIGFEEEVQQRRTVLGNLLRIMMLGIKTRWARISFCRQLRLEQAQINQQLNLSSPDVKTQINEVTAHITLYLTTIRKIAELSFYEKLFSLWHMLHMPIFFMLIITGWVHVYAVHAY